MKIMRTVYLPLILLPSAALVLSGCYTQLATVRDDVEERYSSRTDDRTVEGDDTTGAQSDCTDCKDDWFRSRYRLGFRYYYPSYSSFYFSTFYDPWYYDPWYCYFDPWICGTPFVGRPYWYNWYWAGYYGGYYPGYYGGYYPYGSYRYPYYYPGVIVVSGGTTRTRDSGYRRSGGVTRSGDGYGRLGTSGPSYTAPPASRTSSGGSRDGGATRSVGSGVESSRGSGRVRDSGDAVGTSRGTSPGGRSYSPPSRSGGSSSGSAPSSRGSSGGSARGSGSTRGQYDAMPFSNHSQPSTPTPSYSPSPSNTPAMSFPSAAAASVTSGSGESNRSSGATRSRD